VPVEWPELNEARNGIVELRPFDRHMAGTAAVEPFVEGLLGAIREVIIDTDKGRDVDMAVMDDIEVPSTDFSDLPEPLPTESSQAAPAAMQRTTFSEELVRAGRVLAKSREAMQAMFQDARMGKALDTEHCLPLVNEIADSVERNPGAIVSLARLKTSDTIRAHTATECMKV